MAIVTYGALVTELTGSIGGLTFQRNCAGTICRSKPSVRISKSADQQIFQNRVAYLANYWFTLSQANKDTWIALAAAHDHTDHWGNTRTLNGFQWFMSCNLNLMQTGAFILDTAPAWATYNIFPDFTLEVTSDYLRCHMSTSYSQAGVYLFAYATPLIRRVSTLIHNDFFCLMAQVIEDTYYVYIDPGWCAKFDQTWSTVFANYHGNIIVHLQILGSSTGFANPFKSAIIKIN